MKLLGLLETDRLLLRWYGPVGEGESEPLQIAPRRSSLVIEQLSLAPGQLREETTYAIYIKAKRGHQITLHYPDPSLLIGLRQEEGGQILHGTLNFRSRIGQGILSMRLDGEPECDLLLEIFPTKLDYATDYQALLQDIQHILTGLALSGYQGATRLGQVASFRLGTEVEWLTLLRNLVSDLSKALYHIAAFPLRALERSLALTPIEKIRQVTPAVQAAVRQKQGAGALTTLPGNHPVHSRLLIPRARPTLDTPEHRWLAWQLQQIQLRLNRLLRQEARQRRTPRQAALLLELANLKTSLDRIRKLTPLQLLSAPPLGPVSLQLLSAPGYREAYHCCQLLLRGLRLDGDILRLFPKDLYQLYETWCYLAILHLLAGECQAMDGYRELLAIDSNGLRVRLKQGQASTVRFSGPAGRQIAVCYNPSFSSPVLPTVHRPDILISLSQSGSAPVHLLLDAKYRLEAGREYQARYGYAGPPEEALNTLHRYRDAILEKDGSNLSRTIVQAIALFPSPALPGQDFYRSRLWQSLQTAGIGAIPCLPGHTEPLRRWLRELLQQSLEELGARAIGHKLRARDEGSRE